jgi:hypothetical protein
VLPNYFVLGWLLVLCGFIVGVIGNAFAPYNERWKEVAILALMVCFVGVGLAIVAGVL